MVIFTKTIVIAKTMRPRIATILMVTDQGSSFLDKVFFSLWDSISELMSMDCSGPIGPISS